MSSLRSSAFVLPFSRQSSPASPASAVPCLVHLPPGAVLAHYGQVAGQPGAVQVVSALGQVLGASFFELRHRFSFVCSVSGAGGWVALQPIPPAASQPPLI
jgi:hypothetical protein